MKPDDLPMITGFGLVLTFLLLGVLMVFATLVIARLVAPRRYTEEKMTPYECGEDPVGNSWIQFNIRFYIFALVFLIFDVEMAFLLPWAVAFRSQELAASYGALAFWDAVVFVAILVVGLIYLWARGDLRWVRPQPQIDKKEPTEREKRQRDMLLGKAV
jgi:NADH-quinone oxidoreductase subunit A